MIVCNLLSYLIFAYPFPVAYVRVNMPSSIVEPMLQLLSHPKDLPDDNRGWSRS